MISKSIPSFYLENKITSQQKAFFQENGFIHFKNFISIDEVHHIHEEMNKIQEKWMKENRKFVNGVPIKYGQDIDGKKMVQRFIFAQQFSSFLEKIIRDPRLTLLFDLVENVNWRIAENEKDGLVINHYVNAEKSKFSQMGWHTDALRDIFYFQKIAPMLNIGIHLDNCSLNNGGLRLLPGTHKQSLLKMLFRKFYFFQKTSDKNEVGLQIDAGDLTIHDGRIWHRVALSSFIDEKSRRRVMYIPVITGKYKLRNSTSRKLFYQRFINYYK